MLAARAAPLPAVPCWHVDLALHSMTAGFVDALADTLHVLRYDPANPKAVARRRVYEQALQGA